ncbi:MFS transporter [Deinococcus radiopugnans]|uniref:MFS transporter n=1 Tax=Deinococcus radiopugnans TaxID=57497 RepID=UPI00068C6C2F|nr:MFS transporter [Deinococcus radiopugnans]
MIQVASSIPSSLRTRLNGLFLLNGVLYASWAVQIPAVQHRFDLNTAELSGLLFALMGGTLVALPLARQCLVVRGARQTGVLSLLLMGVSLGLLGAVTSVPAAFVCALLYGVGFGGMDFTLNGVGGWLEERLGKPIMSGLHAGYSLGALIGAALGTAFIGAALSLGTHLWSASATVVLAGLLAFALFPARIETASEARGRPQGKLLLLLLIPGFFAAFGEGTVTDWSTVYLGGVFELPAAQAGLGFVAFSALMVLGRLSGDRLTQAFGAGRLALAASLASAAGFALVTWAGSAPGAVLGFVLTGAGLSVLAPLTFSAAWRMQGSAGVALLTAVFYGGYLAGPPLTGLTIGQAQLSAAFVLPLLLAALSVGAMLLWPLYRPSAGTPPDHAPLPDAESPTIPAVPTGDHP